MERKNEKRMLFTDKVKFVTESNDTIMYNPVYSNVLGLYLFNTEDRPVREILLFKYKVIVYYVDGRIRVLEPEIVSVSVSDILFQRRMDMSIVGNLFKYDMMSAICYGLDVTKAIDYKNNKGVIRKRSI